MWTLRTCLAIDWMQHMLRNSYSVVRIAYDPPYQVPSLVMFVLDNKNHIESGKNGGLEVDVL